ncbi:MAG: hypothetical protein ACYCZR_05080 [Burkholderiales bacterium]
MSENTHDPLCPLAPYAERIAEGEWDAAAFIDDGGKVQYLGCDCALIARVVERERKPRTGREQVMTDQLLCATCGERVGYAGYNGHLTHIGWVTGHVPTLMPFPAGSKALWIDGVEVTILAADGVQRWAKWPDGVVCTVDIDSLRPVPVKIAEPPVGSVVWDGDVPWVRNSEALPRRGATVPSRQSITHVEPRRPPRYRHIEGSE